ncbi:jg3663 [Pararge aegeria aegeria]|uniref:Jg3663 protein n=1 Tax=Pararge aegeria aegeria TaxID=348720 RepID=A0A8S4S9Q7_9NEOP|nr:jg3663 [Pararge aegeria aegeria]
MVGPSSAPGTNRATLGRACKQHVASGSIDLRRRPEACTKSHKFETQQCGLAAERSMVVLLATGSVT